MTKKELIDQLAAHTGHSKQEARDFLDALAECAYREAANGFTIPGLCKFKVTPRKESKRYNVVTGRHYRVAAHDVLKIVPLKKARNLITPPPPDLFHEDSSEEQPAVASVQPPMDQRTEPRTFEPVKPTPSTPYTPTPSTLVTPPPAFKPITPPSASAPSVPPSVYRPVEKPVDEPAKPSMFGAAPPPPKPPETKPPEPAPVESVKPPEPKPVVPPPVYRPIERPAAEPAKPSMFGAVSPPPEPKPPEPAPVESVKPPEPVPEEPPPVEEPVETLVPPPSLSEEELETPEEGESSADEDVEPEVAAGLETKESVDESAGVEEGDSESIEFPCPHCGETIYAYASDAGSEVCCPDCQGEFRVPGPMTPGPSAEPGPTPAEEEAPPAPAPRKRAAVSDFITFFCNECGQEIEAPLDMVGLYADCPACGSRLFVPEKGSAFDDEGVEEIDEQKLNHPSMTMRMDLSDFLT